LPLNTSFALLTVSETVSNALSVALLTVSETVSNALSTESSVFPTLSL